MLSLALGRRWRRLLLSSLCLLACLSSKAGFHSQHLIYLYGYLVSMFHIRVAPPVLWEVGRWGKVLT